MAEAPYSNPENTICEYFLRNICMYGDGCRKSHRRLPTPPSSGMCKFYLQGKCRFGDKCWNLHALDNKSSSTYPAPSKVSRICPDARISPAKRQFPQQQNCPFQSSQWVQAPEFIPSSSKDSKFAFQLCADFINGRCTSGNRCVNIHGDVCELCLKPCLNPFDKNQRKQHQQFCERDLKRKQELYASKQRSLDKTCGICLDVVIEKHDATERQFGILENCNHIFCFTCIMKWRKVKDKHRDLESFGEPSMSKACPECRVSSDFVTPSKFWFDTEDNKKKMIADHKAYLMTKHCTFFKRGDGHCPYGANCYNLHMLPNGTKVTLPAPNAFDNFRPRELDFMSRLLLTDFWDAPEDFFSSDSDFEDELEELLDPSHLLDVLYNNDIELVANFEF